MLTGIILSLLIFLFFIFFAVYKKDMLSRMFTLNLARPAQEFQAELEKTADEVIKRLETQIAHLEFLLDEADNKIAALDEKINLLEKYENPRLSVPSDGIPTHIAAYQSQINTVSYQSSGGPSDVSGTADLQPKERENVSADKRRLIFAMADQGYTITEIAKATGVGKGEIMLLLQLNKK